VTTFDEAIMEREYGIAAPRHRLPARTRVGGVRLRVGDLERSRDWYLTVLGLRELESGPGRVALGAANGTRALVELVERPGAAPAPPRGRPGLYHFALLLPDREALGSFVGHLSGLGERAGASDHLVSEALYLRDPDGLGIEVYADRPRDRWRHRDGELVMATEPLDIGDLVRASDGRVWAGMPSGTTMGHIHLHVGDLERASSFYHETLGLDRVVWSYPGALFLSAGGYHHHLGLNTWAPSVEPAGEDEARLLEWELVLPSTGDVDRTSRALESGGYRVERSGTGIVVRDPWGTPLRVSPAEADGVGG
jgi:catechol 2,3-dioxygenase